MDENNYIFIWPSFLIRMFVLHENDIVEFAGAWNELDPSILRYFEQSLFYNAL